MREVTSLDEMPQQLLAARREAEASFGDGNVYLEKLVEGARHIEFQILADAYGWDLSRTGVYQRKGIIGERKREEIGIQTLRAGDVVGEHTVLFAGTGERLELVHRAQSRDCFAQGALYAAQWLLRQPDGLYDMQDVLGLK